VLDPHKSSRDGGECVPGVVTATFTGKAALVLRRKGTPARTIHSLIYSVIVATDEEIEAAGRGSTRHVSSWPASTGLRPKPRSRPCGKPCRR
jgi:exodeoxyribonuclease-5